MQDIIVIALCAVIAGAQDWQEIVTLGHKRLGWLKHFLKLPHGVPSHDTFERVFDRLRLQAFQACFQEWVRAVRTALQIKHVAIDGKTLRRSGSAKLGPLHLVSAWAAAQHLSLGQVAVGAKSNEITAIPALLELLELNGALVTIDAMGCQKDIARKIVDGAAHGPTAGGRPVEVAYGDGVTAPGSGSLVGPAAALSSAASPTLSRWALPPRAADLVVASPDAAPVVAELAGRRLKNAGPEWARAVDQVFANGISGE